MVKNNSGTNRVVKNSAFYSFSQLVTKVSTFLLLPVYTRLLTNEVYGRVNLLTSFIYVAALLVNLSLNQAMIRYYSDFKYDKAKCKRFFGTIITFMICLGIVVMSVMLIFRVQVTKWLFSGIDFFPAVLLTILSLGCYAVYSMYQAILQAMQDGKKATINSMTFFAIQVVLNLTFLIGFKNTSIGGLNGMVLSHFICYLVFAAYGVIYMIRKDIISLGIDKDLLKMSLIYSIPLLPHNLANSMASYISKHFLNAAALAAQNGIFSVSMQFSSIIDIVQGSINLAFRPWFNDNMKRGEEGKKEIIDFALLTFKLSCIFCLGVALFAQEAVVFLDKSYYDAWKYVPILAITHAVKFIYYTHTLGILYDVKTSKKMFMCSGTGIAVNLILCALFVEQTGAWGAAVAFFISRTVSAVISVIICRKQNIIKYPLRGMVWQIVIVAVFSVIGLIPVNYLVYGGAEFAMFSAPFFINIAYKLLVFALGVWIIAGKQGKEIIGLAKNVLIKKKSSK